MLPTRTDPIEPTIRILHSFRSVHPLPTRLFSSRLSNLVFFLRFHSPSLDITQIIFVFFFFFFFFAKSFTSQPNDIEIFIPKEKCISFLNERIRKLRKSKEKSKESNGLGLYYKENVASGHRVEIVVSNINDFNLNRTFETIFSYDFREQRFATFASRLDPCVFVRLTFRIPDTFAPVYLPCFRAKIDRSLFFTGIFSRPRGKKETFAK